LLTATPVRSFLMPHLSRPSTVSWEAGTCSRSGEPR
jgi:hypothetical protein